MFWRCGASIPVPIACEASALPFELHPRTLQASEQNPWYISFRFARSCQFLPIISKHEIELSKPRKCFGDAGHRSPYLSHAKRTLYHLSYIPVPLSFELASEQNPWFVSFRFVTSCQFLPIISKHQIELSKPQKVLEMRGTDPRTSRMQSGRSTISATFPYSSSFELASEQINERSAFDL